jgi:hypothetical protein
MAMEPQTLSWRDPDGFVMRLEGRLLRAVELDKYKRYARLLSDPWLTKLIGEGLLPRTVAVEPPAAMADAKRWAWFQHETLSFPCYPHEITALQLYDSAMLTLRIAIEAVQHGWLLKDASAWNVLHAAGRPVFVDLLSFEPLTASGTWIAYGQYVRHFLLPLLLYKKLGMTPPEIFLAERDGMTPERAFKLLHGLQRLSPTALELIVLPRLLSPAGSRMINGQATYKPRNFAPDMAKELLLGSLRRLQRKTPCSPTGAAPIRRGSGTKKSAPTIQM